MLRVSIDLRWFFPLTTITLYLHNVAYYYASFARCGIIQMYIKTKDFHCHTIRDAKQKMGGGHNIEIQ